MLNRLVKDKEGNCVLDRRGLDDTDQSIHIRSLIKLSNILNSEREERKSRALSAAGGEPQYKHRLGIYPA